MRRHGPSDEGARKVEQITEGVALVESERVVSVAVSGFRRRDVIAFALVWGGIGALMGWLGRGYRMAGIIPVSWIGWSVVISAVGLSVATFNRRFMAQLSSPIVKTRPKHEAKD